MQAVDLDQLLAKAAAFLDCDMRYFREAARVSASRVLDRDLLFYAAWQLEVRTNSQLGEIFGLSGSVVSRRVRIMKLSAATDKRIRNKI
jgi:hypothetical protein